MSRTISRLDIQVNTLKKLFSKGKLEVAKSLLRHGINIEIIFSYGRDRRIKQSRAGLRTNFINRLR